MADHDPPAPPPPADQPSPGNLFTHGRAAEPLRRQPDLDDAHADETDADPDEAGR